MGWVVPSTVQPYHLSTKGDFPFQGLSTGVFETTSNFQVQLRDRFSNIVTKGPIKEMQVIKLIGDSGEFTVGLHGHVTEFLSIGASASTLEFELEKLPSVEAVTVTLFNSSMSSWEYTVTFESRLGDLNPMYINSTGIANSGGAKSASVENCDWYRLQTITSH